MSENDHEMLPLSERRQRGLNDLAAVVENLWGHRCSRTEGGCGCCTAWAIFDCIERLTDSSFLDDTRPEASQQAVEPAVSEEAVG